MIHLKINSFNHMKISEFWLWNLELKLCKKKI